MTPNNHMFVNHPTLVDNSIPHNGTWQANTTTQRDESRSPNNDTEIHISDLQPGLLGEENSYTLTNMINMANKYFSQGRREDEEALRALILDIQTGMLGEVHPETLRSMNCLANIYRYQRKWNAAGPLQVQVLEMLKRILGEEHLHTLRSMNYLAITYYNQGKWNVAETLQVEALEMLKMILGEEYPDTLTCMNNLAMMHSLQGKWDGAEILQTQLLDMLKRVLGEGQPHDVAAIVWSDEQSLDVPTEPPFTGSQTQNSNHHYNKSPEFLDVSPGDAEATRFSEQSTGFFHSAHDFEMNGTNQFADFGGAEDITVNMIGSYNARTTHIHQETGSATSMAFVAGASIALQVQSMLHPSEQSVQQKPNDSYAHSGPDIGVDASHVLSTCTLLIMGLRHVLPDAVCSKIRKRAGWKYDNVQEIMKDQSSTFNLQVTYEKITVSLSSGADGISSLD